MRNFFYFISQSFKNLFRNRVMTLASISVLMSCLVVMGGFAMLVMNINNNLDILGLQNEIVVFVDYDLSKDEVQQIREKIESLDNVDTVTYIPKEEGLSEMSDRYSDEYSSIFEILKEDNPFADAFTITYKDNAEVSTLDYNLRHIDGVKTVNNRVDLSIKIENLKKGISFIFIWFLVILFVVSIFIIVNTIKLSVFSRRNEINIMRYIGATRTFIVAPFIVDGIIIGLVSSVIAYFIEWYIYSYVYTAVQTDIQFVTLFPFSDVNKYVFLAFLSVGIVTGIVGSCISLRKYMKV